MTRILITLLLLAHSFSLHSEPYVYSSGVNLIGSWVSVLEDTSNSLSPGQAFSANNYIRSSVSVQNFDVSRSTFWIKFSVINKSRSNKLFLDVGNALLDTCELYKFENGKLTLVAAYGVAKPYNDRLYKYPNFIFNLSPNASVATEYLLKINSNEQMVVPLMIENSVAMSHDQTQKSVITGSFIGIMVVMIFYNFFIFFSINDKSYLYYIVYLLFIGLTQITLSGHTFELFFANTPKLFNKAIVIFPCLAGVGAIFFIRSFLNTKFDFKVWDKLLIGVGVAYTVAFIFRIMGYDRISSRMVDVSGLIASLLVFAFFIVITIQGSRQGKFLLTAWTIFLVGLVIFILKNFSIAPFNNFTNYILQIGIAAQVSILSIALADKINILQNETRKSQKLALMAAQENERILSEQNVLLDQQVKVRTQELSDTNANLEQTLIDLKEAEAQLVESEKMSSLGQLTAGIAHEINNPINFVTSNVKPLKRDIEIIRELLGKVETVALSTDSHEEKQKQVAALKEEADLDYLSMEMDHLLKGIGEGASRTAEIVKGLRVFSRLDEDDLKFADLNEGLESTLVIVNNLLNGKITLEKNYAELPLAECYPGKLNQVFLNIITNAIHAIKERWKDEPGGQLKVSTVATQHDINIHIQDNGTGMTEATKKKLFEPFFTTKDVGVGTGLGLSIVWNTIKKHNGQIQVNSEEGVGTEFVITIPIKYTEPQND